MRRAIALCGGGSKGSYQLGAWTALRELGIDFDIVTGTSIGSLNGLMMVQDEYERCKELWGRLEADMLMNDGINIESFNTRYTINRNIDVTQFLKLYITSIGVDINPFKNLLNEYCKPKKLLESDKDFGIVVATFPSRRGLELKIKELSEKEIPQYILGSCSCFPIFPVCKIDNKQYIDGGFFDNLPIGLALDMGADEIIAIDLNDNITHKEFLNKPFIKYIHPHWNLGSFLCFDKSIMERNEILGYYDTMKMFGKYDGFKYTFNKHDKEDSIYRTFILMLSKDVNLFRKKKVKTLIKPKEEGNMFRILEKNAQKSFTDYDYFLRTIEMVGEVFSLPAAKVYNVKDFVKELIANISILIYNLSIKDDYYELKVGKRKEFLLEQDDKDLIALIFNEMNTEELKEEVKLNIMATKPSVYFTWLFLEFIKDFDIDGELNDL